MLDSIVTWLVNIGMAVGPIMGYVSQYRLINASKSVGSFSIDICGILLFANILRLNFYIFKQYQLTLFFQSLFMISMQVLLLYECSKYPPSEDPNIAEEIQPALEESRINAAMNKTEEFWRWRGFQKYGVAILFFSFCSCALSLILAVTPVSVGYGEFVGLVALLSQVRRNVNKEHPDRPTNKAKHLEKKHNRPKPYVGNIQSLWRYFKTHILCPQCTVRHIQSQPFQFILCGIVQVILDSFVVFQIWYYRHEQSTASDSKNGDAAIKPEVLNQEQNLNYNHMPAIESGTNLQGNVKTLTPTDNYNDNENDKGTEQQLNPVRIGEEIVENYDELQEEVISEEEEDDEKVESNMSKKTKSQESDKKVSQKQQQNDN